MIGLLSLLWLASVVLLWACAIHSFNAMAAEADVNRRARITSAITLATVPPTLVFLVSAFVLLQSSPTVQFNAGSSWASDLWSFWVKWYPITFWFSLVQAGGYLLWLIGTLMTQRLVELRFTIGFAFLASVWASLLLSMAYPTA